MNTRHFLLACGAAALMGALPLSAQKVSVAWELTEGIKAPESAYFHAKSGVIYLSQIGEGGGKAKDGDGWISKITPDGRVISDKWFTGLHAPKGMRASNGILWVADIDRLVGIYLANGKTARVYNIPGAKFLNDVATGPRGTIFVSDMPASKIYQVRGGRVTVAAQGEKLDCPNGLLGVGNSLIIAGWGKGINENFEVKTPGRLLSLDLRSKDVTAITKAPTGNLDGVELDGRGGYFVTDWVAGVLFHISSRGVTRKVLELPKGTADIAYIVEKKLLILPQMLENTVTAYDMSKFK